MEYIPPSDVISPKNRWHLFDVVLDRGEGQCAYALGTWEGARRIGFRWNGNAEDGPLGNPQSRGLPTWAILDPALHEAVLALLNPEKRVLARRFLGLRDPAAWRTMLVEIQRFHKDRLEKIASGKGPVAPLYADRLVVHVVPFSAVEGTKPRVYEDLFKEPAKFPPIGRDHPAHFRITHDGLLLGANERGLDESQGAYTQVWRSGIVEAVRCGVARTDNRFELPKIERDLVWYSRLYLKSLNSAFITPPAAIIASLLGVKDKIVLHDFIRRGEIPCDLPSTVLSEDIYTFKESILETVPESSNECAQMLLPTLTHLADTAGVSTPPGFDGEGNYILQ
jgi:hypothetical protein